MSWLEYFIHVANVLYLFSYLVRDVLWLRLLTVVAASTLIPYFVANELVAPIVWNVLFTAINIFQIRLLILERRPVQLPPEEERLYRLAFRALRPREFQRLAKQGHWKTAVAGEILLTEATSLDALRVLTDGEAEVVRGDELLARITPGSLVGEISYLTGAPTTASVRARTDVTFMEWPLETLEPFLEKSGSTRAALQLVIGTDLATKLNPGARPAN